MPGVFYKSKLQEDFSLRYLIVFVKHSRKQTAMEIKALLQNRIIILPDDGGMRGQA